MQNTYGAWDKGLSDPWTVWPQLDINIECRKWKQKLNASV